MIPLAGMVMLAIAAATLPFVEAPFMVGWWLAAHAFFSAVALFSSIRAVRWVLVDLDPTEEEFRRREKSRKAGDRDFVIFFTALASVVSNLILWLIATGRI